MGAAPMGPPAMEPPRLGALRTYGMTTVGLTVLGEVTGGTSDGTAGCGGRLGCWRVLGAAAACVGLGATVLIMVDGDAAMGEEAAKGEAHVLTVASSTRRCAVSCLAAADSCLRFVFQRSLRHEP